MSIQFDAINEIRSNAYSTARLSIFHLKSYLVGVQTAQLILQEKDASIVKFTDTFEKFILEKYGKSSSTFLSIFQASRNHAEATNLWLDEFCKYSQSYQNIGECNNAHKISVKVLDVAGWLSLIESKPLMMISSKDITHLRAFFDGVEFVGKYFGCLELKPSLFLFEKWLRAKKNPQYACSWDMLLVLSTGGNTVDAFSLFFSELHSFQMDKFQS